jgi:hypothetical protein
VHCTVKSATALLVVLVALEVATTIGAVGATANYATPSAHNLVASTKPVPTGHVGTTIVITGVAGAKAAVTFVKVVDPARATEHYVTPPPAGDRFVGAEFRLVGQGSGHFPGADTVLDVTVTGSNSRAYESEGSTAYSANIVGCTNIFNEKAWLSSGQSLTGCVVFTIPDGVKVARVLYSEPGGTKGEWAVP